MMHYEGNIIRPPSEARSIILQATVGCSHNRCSFCPTYRGVRFRIKDEETLLSDIRYANQHTLEPAGFSLLMVMH